MSRPLLFGLNRCWSVMQWLEHLEELKYVFLDCIFKSLRIKVNQSSKFYDVHFVYKYYTVFLNEYPVRNESLQFKVLQSSLY